MDERIDSSILLSIKKMIGGIDDPDDETFNTDLKVLINSQFRILYQLGVGPQPPDPPYSITGPDEEWTEFNYGDIESVKEWMFLTVKVVFDPPSNSTVLSSYKEKAKELEWRMHIMPEEDK